MRVDKCWWLLIFSLGGWIWTNADVYWYVGWVNKSPKICWSNKRMVPYPEVHWEQINGSLVMELLRVKLLVWQGQLRLRLVCRCIPLRSQTWSLSTPDANTMGVTSAHCQLQFSGRPSHCKITRSIKILENFLLLFVCLFVCLLKEILWSQTWSVSTPDSNTMGVTSSHCHPQFSGRPSCYKTTRSLKTLENFMFVYLFVCLLDFWRRLCEVKCGVYQLLMPTQWG